MSIRSTVGAALTALAALAVATSAVLVVLTTRMHATATTLRRAAEAVELAEGAHLALVSYDALARERAEGGPPALARMLEDREAELGQRLAALRAHVRGDAAAMLEETVRDVQAYLRALTSGMPATRGTAAHAAFEAARAQLEELVRVSLRDAHEAEARTARWNDVADALGIGTAVLALAAIAALIAWIGARVLAPMSALSRAVAAYDRDRSARASADAPAELRDFAAAFNQMADGLDRQRELQLAFVAAVAHDLRNPLTALQMALQRVRPDRPLPPEDRIRHVVDVSRRQVERLEKLLEDFLDASRIEAGRMSLSLADADLRDLAREAADLFADASPDHPIALDLPEGPVVARCDPARVTQVVNNLISNAIKYSPRGGRVAVAVARDGGDAVLGVSDEGVGVPEGEREQIFEPFRRGASAHGVPGAGLGLSTARRIAEAHGGRLEVEPRAGGGSTFRLRLPASPRGAGAAPASAGGAP